MTIPILPRLCLGRPLEEAQPLFKGEKDLEALPPNLHYQGLPIGDNLRKCHKSQVGEADRFNCCLILALRSRVNAS
ncbi:hypothetical protein Osc7112_2456 [Oscillatoria nigro-viridis PCC 7112]|uniref:Uncharacterized protein n=1 Tax=Phormidium nigroviride PCC 7112 TaxID=179408 RepID=K9VI21_9CYAN|nr:hypothetical protein Osc7112_2456 [Oscillatoria nigro-viridis PCC 7112]